MKNFVRKLFLSGMLTFTSSFVYSQPKPPPPKAPTAVSCNNLRKFKIGDYTIIQHLDHAKRCAQEINRYRTKEIVPLARKADDVKLEALSTYMKVETSLGDNLGFKPKKNQEAVEESKTKLTTAIAKYQECIAASEEGLDKLTNLTQYMDRIFKNPPATLNFAAINKDPVLVAQVKANYIEIEKFYRMHSRDKDFQNFKSNAVAAYDKAKVEKKSAPEKSNVINNKHWSLTSLKEYCDLGSANSDLIQKDFDSLGYKLNKVALWGGAIGLLGWGIYEIIDHQDDKDKKKKRRREQAKVSECLKNISAHDNCEELIKKYVGLCEKNTNAHPECAAILGFNSSELPPGQEGPHASAPPPAETPGDVPAELITTPTTINADTSTQCLVDEDNLASPDEAIDVSNCAAANSASSGEEGLSSSSNSSSSGDFNVGGGSGNLDIVPLNNGVNSGTTTTTTSSSGGTDVTPVGPSCELNFSDGSSLLVPCTDPQIDGGCVEIGVRADGGKMFSCNRPAPAAAAPSSSPSATSSPAFEPTTFDTSGGVPFPTGTTTVPGDGTSVETIIDVLGTSRGTDRPLAAPKKSKELKENIKDLLK